MTEEINVLERIAELAAAQILLPKKTDPKCVDAAVQEAVADVIEHEDQEISGDDLAAIKSRVWAILKRERLDKLARKLAGAADDHNTLDVATACSSVMAHAIYESYDSHEARVAALVKLEVFMRDQMLALQKLEEDGEDL